MVGSPICPDVQPRPRQSVDFKRDISPPKGGRVRHPPPLSTSENRPSQPHCPTCCATFRPLVSSLTDLAHGAHLKRPTWTGRDYDSEMDSPWCCQMVPGVPREGTKKGQRPRRETTGQARTRQPSLRDGILRIPIHLLPLIAPLCTPWSCWDRKSRSGRMATSRSESSHITECLFAHQSSQLFGGDPESPDAGTRPKASFAENTITAIVKLNPPSAQSLTKRTSQESEVGLLSS